MSIKSQELFSEFSPVSFQQWKQKVQYELKGEDYNQSLTWESPDGIRVNPIYNPGMEYTYQSPNQGFRICQEFFAQEADTTARLAQSSLKRGADSLRIHIPNSQAIRELFDSIDVTGKTVFLSFDRISESDVQLLKSCLENKAEHVFFLLDPIHHLAENGNWIEGQESLDWLGSIQNEYPSCGTLSVNASLYQHAGATPVQEVAFALAHLTEYFNRFKSEAPIVIEVAMGTEYFFEIAKLRALRQLFELVAQEFGHSAGCHLFARPSKRYLTLYDYNVNLLRTTTACMSAILGGADTIANLPYDVIYHKSNEFGERIARNQLLILKHESNFNQVSHASDGSYYLEELTQEIASKALKLFKEIEAEGGFIKGLESGKIQKTIQQQHDIQQHQFDSGEWVMVGSNKYPDPANKMAHDLELYPFAKKKSKKTILQPIIERRLSENYEKDRLEKEEASAQ